MYINRSLQSEKKRRKMIVKNNFLRNRSRLLPSDLSPTKS